MEKLTAVNEVHDNVKVLSVLEREVQAREEGVGEAGQDVLLSPGVLNLTSSSDHSFLQHLEE